MLYCYIVNGHQQKLYLAANEGDRPPKSLKYCRLYRLVDYTHTWSALLWISVNTDRICPYLSVLVRSLLRGSYGPSEFYCTSQFILVLSFLNFNLSITNLQSFRNIYFTLVWCTDKLYPFLRTYHIHSIVQYDQQITVFYSIEN